MNNLKLALSVFFTIFSFTNSFSEKAHVLDVVDSDTLIVIYDDTVKVVLQGIECPEKDQPWGDHAFQKVKDLCYKREISLFDVDTVGDKILSANIAFLDTITFNGEVKYRLISLQDELIKSGLAWLIKDFKGNAFTRVLFYPNAQKNKIGLWVDPKPVHPSIWKTLNKDQKDSLNTLLNKNIQE